MAKHGLFILSWLTDWLSWFFPVITGCCCLVAQSCPALCETMDCNLPGSSVHADSLGKNTGVGCHAFLQGILPTQGSKPGLLHCGQILYRLSHQGRPTHHVSFSKNAVNLFTPKLILIWIFTIWEDFQILKHVGWVTLTTNFINFLFIVWHSCWKEWSNVY